MQDENDTGNRTEPSATSNNQGKEQKSAVSESTTVTGDSLRRLSQKSIDLSSLAAKTAFNASKATASWIASKTREQIERQKQRRAAAEEEAYSSCVAHIRSLDSFVSASALAAVESFEKESTGDTKSRFEFTKSELVRSLIGRAEARKDFSFSDKARQGQNAIFTTYSGELLDLLPSSLVSSRLSAVKSKYYASNVSNVVAGAIFGARGNGAGSAAALAQSARVGHYNAKVKSAFGENIRQIKLSVPCSKLESAHHQAIVACYRLVFFGFDEDNIASRALFCLIYANGHADAIPPNAGEFSSALFPEFHNNFKDQVWTIKDSMMRVFQILEKNSRARELLKPNDISLSMNQFLDPVPSYGEIRGSRKR